MADIVRKEYRKLTDDEIDTIDAIKNAGQALADTIETNAAPGRERSLAITKTEEAVMWAVKGVTG